MIKDSLIITSTLEHYIALFEGVAESSSVHELDFVHELDLMQWDKQIEEWERTVIAFLTKELPNEVEYEIKAFLKGNIDNEINSFRFGFNFDGEALIEKAKTHIGNLKAVLDLLKSSDPFIDQRSFVVERSDLSVQQKKEVLLEKLYSLRKIDRYWSARLILSLNDVTLDNEYEASELIDSLKKSGHVQGNSYPHFGCAQITVTGKDFIEKKLRNGSQRKPKMNELMENSQSVLDIFISHSSQDKAITKALIDLIRAALPIKAEKIRCTSVDGYRLPVGATTDELLKNEVNNCKILIGIISESSMSSAYVLFELGARWGQGKTMFPLITGAKGKSLLKGPLSSINALELKETAQLHQLINDLAVVLKIKSESPAVYHDKIERVLEYKNL